MKQKKITSTFGPLLLVFVVGLSACTSKQPKTLEKTYRVEPTPIHKTLYFTGTIQPIQVSVLSNPIDATIETMPYRFGQEVAKNDIVFTLRSAELQKQYHDTLTEYLKAKDGYTIAESKFAGTNDLWKAGLIAKNNYLSEKSSLNTAKVTLMQSERKLSEILDKMGDGTYQHLSHLSFADFDKVSRALSGNHDIIKLKSPSHGVLLYPPKSGDTNSERISVGSAVKTGQALALIGDLSGIRIEIDVPEVDIDKIKPGMPATIRGVAFAKEELKGSLVSVNAEASMGSASALPSFSATVLVKKLPKNAWIKVGMSASIELAIDSTDKLLVPIEALKQIHGKSIVYVQTAKGKKSPRTVTTGAAFKDKVVIDSGLRAGEVIVYE